MLDLGTQIDTYKDEQVNGCVHRHNQSRREILGEGE